MVILSLIISSCLLLMILHETCSFVISYRSLYRAVYLENAASRTRSYGYLSLIISSCLHYDRTVKYLPNILSYRSLYRAVYLGFVLVYAALSFLSLIISSCLLHIGHANI